MKLVELLAQTVFILLLLTNSLIAQSFSEIKPGENGVPDAIWPEIYFNSFDRAIASLEILPLRDMELGKQSKEIRFWTGVSTGFPKSLYIISKNENEVEGKLVLYWDASDIDAEPEGESFHDLMIYNYKGSCDKFTLNGGMGYCIAVFENSPNWESIYHNALKAGIWDLPDESELPSEGFILDGWVLVVELRNYNHYRTYKYSNPDSRDWPEAASAVEINSIITSVWDHMKPSNVRRTYKGITSGEYRSAFKVCESEEIWGFRGSHKIEGLAEKAGIELPEPGESGYIVEVYGTPTPEWLARSWNSDYIREIQTDSLISIESATSPDCK